MEACAIAKTKMLPSVFSHIQVSILVAPNSVSSQGTTTSAPLNKIGKCHAPQIMKISMIETTREYRFVSAGNSHPRHPSSSPIPITTVWITKCMISNAQLSARMLDSLFSDRPPIKKEVKVRAVASIGNNRYQPACFFSGINFFNRLLTPFFPVVRKVTVTAAKAGPTTISSLGR